MRWLEWRNWARRAKFLHNAFAQSLGIALTRFYKFDDLVCEYFIGKVPRSASRSATRAISKARRMKPGSSLDRIFRLLGGAGSAWKTVWTETTVGDG